MTGRVYGGAIWTSNEKATMPRKNRLVGLGILSLIASLLGCDERIDGYVAASSISRNGFAKDACAVRGLVGREISLWGFVDAHNLYGDASAKTILGDWWSGEGAEPRSWHFHLKARADDAPGHSFRVTVPNDAGRDALLRAFIADAEAQGPTQVFVTGRLSTFEAPAGLKHLTGLYLEVQTSRDVQLANPGHDRRAQP